MVCDDRVLSFSLAPRLSCEVFYLRCCEHHQDKIPTDSWHWWRWWLITLLRLMRRQRLMRWWNRLFVMHLMRKRASSAVLWLMTYLSTKSCPCLLIHCNRPLSFVMAPFSQQALTHTHTHTHTHTPSARGKQKYVSVEVC